MKKFVFLIWHIIIYILSSTPTIPKEKWELDISYNAPKVSYLKRRWEELQDLMIQVRVIRYFPIDNLTYYN